MWFCCHLLVSRVLNRHTAQLRAHTSTLMHKMLWRESFSLKASYFHCCVAESMWTPELLIQKLFPYLEAIRSSLSKLSLYAAAWRCSWLGSKSPNCGVCPHTFGHDILQGIKDKILCRTFSFATAHTGWLQVLLESGNVFDFINIQPKVIYLKFEFVTFYLT